jgi:hypothetical protein
MGIGAAIVGSAVVGGVVASQSASKQAKAAGQATDAQVASNAENIAFQKEVFAQQREDNAPWREIGADSLKRLEQGIASGDYDPGKLNLSEFSFDFKADPGYQFRKQEGINALDASASARGRLQSGAQSRAVSRYGSDLASQEYGNAFNRSLAEYQNETSRTMAEYNSGASRKQGNFNRLASLANVGQVANSADQAARSNMASNVSASTTASGNAIAQGAINKGNARASAYQGIGQSVNQGMQNYLLYDALGTG